MGCGARRRSTRIPVAVDALEDAPNLARVQWPDKAIVVGVRVRLKLAIGRQVAPSTPISRLAQVAHP